MARHHMLHRAEQSVRVLTSEIEVTFSSSRTPAIQRERDREIFTAALKVTGG